MGGSAGGLLSCACDAQNDGSKPELCLAGHAEELAPQWKIHCYCCHLRDLVFRQSRMLLLLQADWILLQAGWPQGRRQHQSWWTFPPQVVVHSLSWRKASGGMVSRVLMCPHIVPPALVGYTLDGRHSVLDKGLQLLGIFLYPGQHNLGVNPVIGVGFFHLENGGNLGQQLGQQQTPQELQSGHGDRLVWSYPGLGCHLGHSDGGILVDDSGIHHSSIASFAGVSEAIQLL